MKAKTNILKLLIKKMLHTPNDSIFQLGILVAIFYFSSMTTFHHFGAVKVTPPQWYGQAVSKELAPRPISFRIIQMVLFSLTSESSLSTVGNRTTHINLWS